MDGATAYGMSGSGNSHEPCLPLDRLERPCEWVEVDLPGAETWIACTDGGGSPSRPSRGNAREKTSGISCK